MIALVRGIAQCKMPGIEIPGVPSAPEYRVRGSTARREHAAPRPGYQRTRTGNSSKAVSLVTRVSDSSSA